MSYDATIKRHIINILAPRDHKHLEMTEALNCNNCGHRMLKAQSEYKRLTRQYPEKFIRKEPEPDDTKIQLLNEKLQDRINNDSLYHKHTRILQSGKPKEKREEIKKFWGGFYEKNVGDRRRKTLL